MHFVLYSNDINTVYVLFKFNSLKKAERNRRIVDMADAGINHKEIAESVGVSLRTVQTILKNSGKTRAYISIVNVQKNAS